MSNLFAVTGRQVLLRTTEDQTIRVFRAELSLRLWNGTRFGPELPGLWDTGADFVVVSEAFAVQHGIDLSEARSGLGASGIGGSSGGVFVPLAFRVGALRDLAFQVDCQVLLDEEFPQPLLGNYFIRRNFNVATIGERRTFFRLREPAPDAVPVARLRTG